MKLFAKTLAIALVVGGIGTAAAQQASAGNYAVATVVNKFNQTLIDVEDDGLDFVALADRFEFGNLAGSDEGSGIRTVTPLKDGFEDFGSGASGKFLEFLQGFAWGESQRSGMRIVSGRVLRKIKTDKHSSFRKRRLQ